MDTENINGISLDCLSPEEVKQRFDDNKITLIDVRTPNEYAFEHIGGAMLFPLSKFDPEKLPNQHGKPIVFLCGTSVRSHKIVAMCAKAGIKPLAHMQGGFNLWKESGLPFFTIDPTDGKLIEKQVQN